jgi:hypothetical protein
MMPKFFPTIVCDFLAELAHDKNIPLSVAFSWERKIVFASTKHKREKVMRDYFSFLIRKDFVGIPPTAS